MDSHQLIAVSNVRTAPAGIRLWFSSDAGETWSTDSPVQMWDATEEKMKGTFLKMKEKTLEGVPQRIWDALPGFTFGMPYLVRLGEDVIKELLTLRGGGKRGKL